MLDPNEQLGTHRIFIFSINHDILLYKLEHYGFRGIVLEWFKSHLNNRTQFVRYQMHDSDRRFIKCGVPEGSILGPLLFILYINEIVNTTSLHLFSSLFYLQMTQQIVTIEVILDHYFLNIIYLIHMISSS